MRCILTHELRNGIAVIVGECELIQAADEADVIRRLRVAKRTALHIADVLEQHECELETLALLARTGRGAGDPAK